MKKVMENKGITLIALVITIIVLLILAAVSIATLTGKNGILTKARNAKEQTEIAEVKERVQTDILGVQAENKSGDIAKKEFVKILKKYFDGVPTADKLPEDLSTLVTTKSKYGSHDIKISDIWNGKFGGEEESSGFNENEFTLNVLDAKQTDQYGWKVLEYLVQTSEMNTNVWRLFYQDSNYTYLITDECIGRYQPSDYYTNYTSGADVSIIGKKLNPLIETLFTATNTNTNIRATAWLTDSSKWSDYKNDDAVFAIGGPTAELFAASYNNRNNGLNKIELGLGAYGYTDNTGAWSSIYDNKGIYSSKNSSSDWWIASPDADDDDADSTMYVMHGGFFDRYGGLVFYNKFAVRPIVCIPTSVFNNKYSLVDE